MNIILIFIDWFVPGYRAGGPISSNKNLIAHLSNTFNFKVITRNTDYEDVSPYENITPNGWSKMVDFEGYYISNDNLKVSTLNRIIKSTPCDFAYINGIYSFYFSILPILLCKRKKIKNIIISSRGMLSPQAFTSKGYRKIGFIKLMNFLGLYKNVTFHATNNAEAENITHLLGKKTKTIVAPNLPKKMPSIITRNNHKKTLELKLISVARISPEKNTLFALEALMKLKTILPPNASITYNLYGTIYDTSYWNKCLALIEKLSPEIIVNYCGSIDNNLTPELYQKSHFLFLPTQGENFGHSILEAFQNGCPVIISDKTPWRDLAKNKNEIVGWDLPLSNIDIFASTLLNCLNLDDTEYCKLSMNAIGLAKKVNDNIDVLEANLSLFSTYNL